MQRWLALSQLLLRHNWQLTVITVDEKYASYAVLDHDLVADIPELVQVVKTKTLEPLQFYAKTIGKGNIPTAGFANEGHPGFLQKVARWVRGNFFIPDPRRGWNRFALKAAKAELQKGQYEWLITAGPPHSTHLMGAGLQKEFGVKWLADFHDAWTGIWYYDELMKTKVVRKWDSALERKVVQKADRLLTVSHKLKTELAASANVDESKIRVHSMGYDAQLFEELQQKDPNRGDFIIAYTGTIANNYAPQAVIESIAHLRKEGLDISIHWAGMVAQDIVRFIEEIGLGSSCTFHGYISHSAVISLLQRSSILLLVSPDTHKGQSIIPGKVYEYLAACRPILNIAPHDAETALMVRECAAGETFTRQEQGAIVAFIRKQYALWVEDAALLIRQNETHKRYSREREAEELAKWLETSTPI